MEGGARIEGELNLATNISPGTQGNTFLTVVQQLVAQPVTARVYRKKAREVQKLARGLTGWVRRHTCQSAPSTARHQHVPHYELPVTTLPVFIKLQLTNHVFLTRNHHKIHICTGGCSALS
ncbi:hypothetical protein E2C01_032828 [Portunus trituberculatus]|uniref:Uncharacterized protein n=1 Tax=Portunus trituberculatus TaxID=210409 RepID=A0A5B7F283_PORTR|nr:hypothetical protein [Portunus trituberculatus]